MKIPIMKLYKILILAFFLGICVSENADAISSRLTKRLFTGTPPPKVKVINARLETQTSIAPRPRGNLESFKNQKIKTPPATQPLHTKKTRFNPNSAFGRLGNSRADAPVSKVELVPLQNNPKLLRGNVASGTLTPQNSGLASAIESNKKALTNDLSQQARREVGAAIYRGEQELGRSLKKNSDSQSNSASYAKKQRDNKNRQENQRQRRKAREDSDFTRKKQEREKAGLKYVKNKGAFAPKGPPNLSPEGAGRRGAFREAKRNNDIPVGQRPSVKPNVDRRGRPQPGKQYEFGTPDGKKTIRDDAGGHNYPDDPGQNRGPHFNDNAGNHYDY